MVCCIWALARARGVHQWSTTGTGAFCLSAIDRDPLRRAIDTELIRGAFHVGALLTARRAIVIELTAEVTRLLIQYHMGQVGTQTACAMDGIAGSAHPTCTAAFTELAKVIGVLARAAGGGSHMLGVARTTVLTRVTIAVTRVRCAGVVRKLDLISIAIKGCTVAIHVPIDASARITIARGCTDATVRARAVDGTVVKWARE